MPTIMMFESLRKLIFLHEMALIIVCGNDRVAMVGIKPTLRFTVLVSG